MLSGQVVVEMYRVLALRFVSSRTLCINLLRVLRTAVDWCSSSLLKVAGLMLLVFWLNSGILSDLLSVRTSWASVGRERRRVRVVRSKPWRCVRVRVRASRPRAVTT